MSLLRQRDGDAGPRLVKGREGIIGQLHRKLKHRLAVGSFPHDYYNRKKWTGTQEQGQRVAVEWECAQATASDIA
jgi:hypothetical protein